MPSAVLSQSADELPDVLHFLAAAPALPFHFISLHAPSKGRRLREKQLVAMLLEVVRSVDAVVVHPDTIDDPARYAALGSALVLENMDARKRDGRTVAELEPYFAALPHAGFCFDVAHAASVDELLGEGARSSAWRRTVPRAVRTCSRPAAGPPCGSPRCARGSRRSRWRTMRRSCCSARGGAAS